MNIICQSLGPSLYRGSTVERILKKSSHDGKVYSFCDNNTVVSIFINIQCYIYLRNLEFVVPSVVNGAILAIAGTTRVLVSKFVLTSDHLLKYLELQGV